MANQDQDKRGEEGRQSGFDQEQVDQEKKDEFGKSKQGMTGRQGDAESGLSERTGQQGESGTGSAGAGSGFVGSNEEESGEYLQDRDPQQAGFAEQGRGAPEEGRDIERGGERTDNFDSDIEGSSKDR